MDGPAARHGEVANGGEAPRQDDDQDCPGHRQVPPRRQPRRGRHGVGGPRSCHDTAGIDLPALRERLVVAETQARSARTSSCSTTRPSGSTPRSSGRSPSGHRSPRPPTRSRTGSCSWTAFAASMLGSGSTTPTESRQACARRSRRASSLQRGGGSRHRLRDPPGAHRSGCIWWQRRHDEARELSLRARSERRPQRRIPGDPRPDDRAGADPRGRPRL